MPHHWPALQGSTSLSADTELHRRLLAMPAANEAPAPIEPGFFSFLTAWRERRFAAACCRELMNLHQSVASHHAELRGEALYRAVVAAHIGGGPSVAEALLQRAQESYALWPVPRALTFRDVVHYLAVSGYWALHHGRRWICSDIRRIIDASIPRHL